MSCICFALVYNTLFACPSVYQSRYYCFSIVVSLYFTIVAIPFLLSLSLLFFVVNNLIFCNSFQNSFSLLYFSDLFWKCFCRAFHSAYPPPLPWPHLWDHTRYVVVLSSICSHISIQIGGKPYMLLGMPSVEGIRDYFLWI